MALHPTRIIEVATPMAETYERCRDGIEHSLGGIIREEDRIAGTIEATFGLIFSERLTCRVEPIDAGRSRVIMEMRRGAQAAAPGRSSYLDALAANVLKND